ncbi:MAG: choice-of-anchor D domain-containing protein [Candidatus Korobacteraceae bacterium]
MKKLYLLILVCMLSVLTFAQTDSSTSSTDQDAGQVLVTNGCVTLTPSSYDFENQPVDFPSNPKAFHLLNGCAVNIIVTNITANGQAFTQTNNCIGTLMPNDFCTSNVVFDPGSVGQKSQTLVILYHKQGSNNQLQISAGLSGTGIHDVTFDPASCDLVALVGSHADCTVKITNQEPQRVTIDRCQVSGEYFSQQSSCPMSLAKNDYVDITIEFSPEERGLFTGQFAVTTNSPEEVQSGNPYTVPLTGVGICNPRFCCNGSGPGCPPSN